MPTPEYKVVVREGAFIPPHGLIPAGSKIAYDGPPGDHLFPLNDEAVARMEEWYGEEHPVRDKDGATVLGPDGLPRLYKPHEKYRLVGAPKAGGASPQAVTVLAPPPADQGDSMTLAETLYDRTKPVSTDQRPGPAPYFAEAPVPDPAISAPLAGVEVAAPTSTIKKS